MYFINDLNDLNCNCNHQPIINFILDGKDHIHLECSECNDQLNQINSYLKDLNNLSYSSLIHILFIKFN